jgi:beta-phosphoglucomutase-like phosphatase (HAD superfamily)
MTSSAPGAALLFDIDGTIADTCPIHLEAFNIAFAPYVHQFDKLRFAKDLQGLANIYVTCSRRVRGYERPKLVARLR